jgi:two-component system, OmpR family, sensor histidine kinase TctE
VPERGAHRHIESRRHSIKFLAEPSIRRQLIFWLVLPLSVALICSALVAYRLASDFVTHAYDRGLYDSALDLSRRLRLHDGKLSVDLPAAAVDMLEFDELDRVYYEIRAHSGELVVGQPGLPRPEAEPEPGRPRYYYGRYHDQSLRLVALRIPYDPNDEQVLALVIVAETLVRRQLLANDILVAVALSQFVLIGMVSLSVYLGVGHGLLPLGRLRQQIESRSHRDLTPLDEPRTPAEVRPLVHAINALMQRLQRAIAAQHRFITDAAHQLRTPLAGLKTHAELALREESLEGMRERVRTLMFAADRSARLTHQLLTLARADPEANAAISMVPVDLSVIAREVASEWVPRAIERGIDLGLGNAPDSVMVRGNSVLLREMLANLVDNAIRYGHANGRVTVQVETSADAAIVSVEDDGPGIPAADQERVFERFQRLDDANAEGCGLGLAIVREIAEAHDATVTLAEGPGGTGTRVSVRFAWQPNTAAKT